MKNILNYREVAAGQKNKDGKEIKNIFRSADVSFASQADMDLLLESGIKNIIDLRSEEEMKKKKHTLRENQEEKIEPNTRTIKRIKKKRHGN